MSSKQSIWRRLAAAFFGPEPTNAEVQEAAQATERTGWAPGWELPAEVAEALRESADGPTIPAALVRVITDKLRRMPTEVPADAASCDAAVVYQLSLGKHALVAIRDARAELLECRHEAD